MQGSFGTCKASATGMPRHHTKSGYMMSTMESEAHFALAINHSILNDHLSMHFKAAFLMVI